MTYPKRSYYKYRPLLADRSRRIANDFTQALIQSCEVYYATPSTFNDPYDCNFTLHADDSTDEDWIRYINVLIAKNPDQAPSLTTVRDNRLWKTYLALNAFGEDARRKHYDESSVLCLSKRGDSIPMFSYYADDHHGIAVELTFSDDEIPCGIPCGDLSTPAQLYQRKIVVQDVVYSPTLPELNYHRLYDSPQLVTSLMFTKLIEWKHEEEFRIFRRGVAASVVQFPKPMLTRIIFGARSSREDIDLVKTWLAGHGYSVVLAKAQISASQFGLSIVDFETFSP
jgi:hypothetical protein